MLRCQAVLLHSSSTEPIDAASPCLAIASDLEGTNPRPQLSATPLGAAGATLLASELMMALPNIGPDPLPFAPAMLG